MGDTEFVPARVGDILVCNVRNPMPQTFRMVLETREAAAYANELLQDERSGWRLECRTTQETP